MQEGRSLKGAAWVAIAAMTLLVAGSIFYFKERGLFLDSSFVIFNIVNDHKLFIQEHRYGSFITQLVPFIGEKAGWSLRTIVMAYSASFHLFYLCTGLLLVLAFRQYRLTILLACYYTLFVTESYFWPTNEVHQSIAWMFLFFGFYNYCKERNVAAVIFYPLFLVLAALAVTTHPLVMFPMCFLWVFLLLQQEKAKRFSTKSIICSVLLLAALVIKYVLSKNSSGGYDASKMDRVLRMNLADVWNAATGPMAREFGWHCILYYWQATLLFFTGLVWMFRYAGRWVISWSLLFPLAYFLLICVTFDAFITFYIEAEWQPLSIMIAAPFVYFALPKIRPVYALLICTIVFGLRIIQINNSSPLFTKRLRDMEALMGAARQQHTDKLIIRRDNDELEKQLSMSWSLPIETLMLSAMDGDSPQYTIAHQSPEELLEPKQQLKNVFMLPWGVKPATALNPYYFHIDTTKTYAVISLDSLRR